MASMAEFQLLPKLVDNIAQQRPDQTFVSIPLGNDVSGGFRDVTAQEFAMGADRLAWFIVDKLGHSDSFETLTYLGPTDVRYPLFALAAAKAGYKSFWTSPRNSFEAHKSLLAATNCKVMVTPPQIPAGIGPVIDEMQLKHLHMPSVDELLNEQPVKPFPFTKTFEEGKQQPFTVIHTSGSTGIPKPITIPFLLFTLPQIHATVPEENGKESVLHWVSQNSTRTFSSFPMFHGAGIFMFFTISTHWNNVPVLPPLQPLTAELAHEIHTSGMVDSTLLPPSVLEDISQDPKYIKGISRLNLAMYAGAALPVSAGDILKSHTRLISMMGQTEVGLPHWLMVDAEDYQYLCPGSHSGVEFRYCFDDLHELVVVRKPELENWQLAFMTFPQLQEIPTNDLYIRHPDPDKPNLWKHHGRKDDVIVFDNGEKLNPVTMEGIIQNHPMVAVAIIIGHGRFQSALLVEPRYPEMGSEENADGFVDSIWSNVEIANMDCPAHGRLVKELVIVASPEKPFHRTAKGGRSRMWTEKQYIDKINKRYEAMEATILNEGTIIDLNGALDESKSALSGIFSDITKAAVDDHTDFYQAGMDSLQTLHLTRKLRIALRNDPFIAARIKPSLIYHNPTLDKLLGALVSLSRQNLDESPDGNTRSDLIEAAIKSLLASHQPSGDKEFSGDRKVILTGSSGNLGSYLLSSLLKDPNTSHVYCLNRSADAAANQARVHENYGLVDEFDPARVTFIQWDVCKPHLGLSDATYNELLRETTHIIHNAWTVDFNRSLDSYLLTDLPGLLRLANLATNAKSAVHFYFVSSVGTMMDWGKNGRAGSVPEIISPDTAAVQAVGYAESKYVAERVLEQICLDSPVNVNILRVGQIAGPVLSDKGCWNPKEWFPSIISSARVMRKLPNTLGISPQIDWIPVDILSETIVDIIRQERQLEAKTLVYNLVNPHHTTWKELYPIVKTYLDMRGGEVEVGGYGQWLVALEEYAAKARTETELSRNPAVKLLEFFKAGEGSTQEIRFCADNVDRASVTFRECTAVTPQWMNHWMEQWQLNDTGKCT